MAIPNFEKLLGQLLQIYGVQSGPPETLRSEPSYQRSQPAYPAANGDAYRRNDNELSTGGVLRGRSAPSPALLPPAQPLAEPIGMRGGLVGSRPGGGARGLPFLPMPPNPNEIVEIPNPHIERHIPPWMREFWVVQSLLPRLRVDNLDTRMGEPDASTTVPYREDRSGGSGWYVGPPKENRILKRVDEDVPSEKEVESPPLAPADTDDTEDTTGCDEELANARRDCEKGMSGPRGAGPYSIPRGPRGGDIQLTIVYGVLLASGVAACL